LVEINSDKISPGDSSLIFVGNAERVEDYLKLTDSKAVGRRFHLAKKQVFGKAGFFDDFRIQFQNMATTDLEPEKSLPGADGFAFVMQNHNYPVLGKKGEAMGYDGITNSLAVEFDLFRNIYDPNGNHIAVQSLGQYPNSPRPQTQHSYIRSE